MNNDLISREALKEDFKSRLADCNEWIANAKDKETKIRASAVKAYIVEVIMTINNAPAIEPLERIGSICEENCGYRPQGKWLFDKENSFTIDIFKCSICGFFGDTHFKFCPDCGAKMKGGAE